MKRLALLFLLAPSMAHAQSQTTDCTRDYFGNIRCTTQQQPGINWGILQPPNVGQSVMDGFARGQAIVNQEQERRAAVARQQAAADLARLQAEVAAERARSDAQTVSESPSQAQIMAEGIALARSQTLEAATRIRAGDCRGAADYALSVGNLVLAKQVKEYCAK